MSKSLSVATAIEKNQLGSATPFLVCLDIGVIDPTTAQLVETVYLVRNSEEIVFNGLTYMPVPFDIELKSESGSQSSVNLSIRDTSRAVQARMQQYGGGVGFRVKMTVVNAGNLTQPPEVVENFEVVGADASDYTASFRLGAENVLSQTFPRRRQTKDFCQWRYKDLNTCGYIGGLETCDLTLQGPNGCAAHNNSRNYGAFPGINVRVIVS
ncbi:hypothetical protein [Cupriavidus campinensis]|uniref:hypothetical protein n=1 Tax=Cupriavidus campinensis TaxID=151783 RepID=UPI0016427B0F|nr:hypothetical protein [Cupriavidus campinensis]